MASKLPVRVTHPTKADSPIAIQATYNSRPSGRSFSLILLNTSDAATSALAAPPNPLNKATISGIPVICTLTAIRYPINPPIASPATIRIKLLVSPKSI